MDALRSYQTLGRNARLLGSLSASFSREAASASDAYRRALSDGNTDAWASFVEAAYRLTSHVESVGTIVDLNDDERAAVNFFEQIVSENADLLALHAAVA